jgi:hypothetical protein
MSANEIVYAVLALSGFAAAIILGVLWMVTSLLRSKSGKTIDAVKRAKKQLILAVTPGHLAHLFKVDQFMPGVLETAKFQSRVGKKRKTFYEPEKTEITLSLDDLSNDSGLTDEQKKESLALTQECLTHMLRANTEKVYLEEGVPVTIALEDKVITAGVKGIGALAFYEKLCKVNHLKEVIATLKESADFKEVSFYLEGLLAKVSLIDIDVLRNYFDSDWSQSDDESQKDYHYTIGYRDGQKKEKGIEKIIVIAGIAIGILGVVGGAVLGYIGGA